MPDEHEHLEASIINYQDALHVALRTRMKLDFLKAMKDQPSPFKAGIFGGGKFVIYGTTLLTLARQAGTKMPLDGLKAGDIDIFIQPRKGDWAVENPDGFGNQYRIIVSPFMKAVVEQCGFKTVDGSLKETVATELKYSQPFLVKKHFSRKEAKRLVSDHKGLAERVPPEGVDVLMEIDLVAQPPISFTPPVDHPLFEGGNTPIQVDDPHNLLAKKIIRSLIPIEESRGRRGKLYQHSTNPNGFKPRDLLDIYNLMHSQPELIPGVAAEIERGATPENGSKLAYLRVLAVGYLARFGKSLEKVDLSRFDPNPENISAFRCAMDKRLSNEAPLTDDEIGDILKNYQRLIRGVFPEHDVMYGKHSIKLNEAEEQFLASIKGFKHIAAGGTQLIDPHVGVEHLKNRYPKVFGQHPDLEKLIKDHPTLNEIAQNIAERRSAFME